MSSSASCPLVSIAIPAHNHGRYLPEAIESVLAQSYPALQVIVIDDGSTDQTADVLTRYSDRVEAVSQANAGQSTTINRAWQRARGDILSYLSADDRLAQDAVSTAVAALHGNSDVVMVYGDYDLIDPASVRVRRVKAPEFDYREMVTDLVCAPGPGVFLRRCAVDQAGGWDPELRQAPDFEYWLRLGLTGRFRRLPVVLADLRVHPGSASYAVIDETRAEEPVRIMTNYFARSDLRPSVRSLEAQSLSSAHLVTARFHIRSGRYRAAGGHLRTAAALHPRTLVTRRAGRLLVNACVNRVGHSALWLLRGSKGHATADGPSN